jgi:hypothetical protein
MWIAVQDSVTGAWIAGGTTVVARDGSYRDSVTNVIGTAAWDALSIAVAEGRAGIYDVTVRRAGYADWHRNGIRVSADDCGPRAVEVVARLQPKP